MAGRIPPWREREREKIHKSKRLESVFSSLLALVLNHESGE
jgi:hypothetical protein